MAICKGKFAKKNAVTIVGYSVQPFIRKSVFFAFNFHHFFCGSCYDPQPSITHAVQKRIKLAALCGLLGLVVQEEKLIYRYVITGNKLIENLETWMLPLVLDIGKIVRGNIHFVAYFLVALFAPFSDFFDCCPKSLEVIFLYRSFGHIYSPSYILRFTFLFGYVYIILTVILYNSLFVHNKRLEVFGWPYIIIVKATVGRMNRVWNISLVLKAQGNGAFLKGGYRSYAKMGASQML